MGLADFIKNGGRDIPNPEYNPKTKKGRQQPPTLVSTQPVDSENEKINTLANTIRTGFTQYGDESKYSEYGVTLNPVNDDKEFNAERARNQSGFEQFGNFLMQAGVGEALIGTLEGFGNIAHGLVNFVTGNNYELDPITQGLHDAKENLKQKFAIYQENPDAHFDFSDSGWIFNGLVNTATTISLMLPAAGWAKGLSLAGKAVGAGKAVRWASRGIAGVSKAGKATNKFGALRAAAGKANRMERTLTNGSEILGTAILSRTGENFMEAKGVYDDVYTNSKENLDNMPSEEFAKFLANNPEFEGKTNDEIAKEIARKSANTTFINDYAMLLMDIPQFKALGKLWGRTGRRATTASERIAAENARRTLAGKPVEELIKDNVWNRTKEGIKYALKNPKSSFAALELGEGFEEIYQGIQTEKGMETASKYFNPDFTPRTLGSYLSDPSIWEQGFWGVIGGITFNKVGRAVQEGSKRIQGMWNKKHMSAEDYERWKRSNTKIATEQLNNITLSVQEYVNDMQTIERGENPYNFIVDPETGQEIIVNGQIVNETIDDNQKQLLRDKALDKFIANTTMTSIDNGTFGLMKEVLGSNEFDKYISDAGLQIDSNDKALSQEVVARMDEIADIYENSLKDVNALADTTNPFITIAAARNITRNKLKIQEYDGTIANINQRIAEINDTNTDFSTYEERVKYDAYKNQMTNLMRQLRTLNIQLVNGDISKAAYEAKKKEIEKTTKVWNDWAQANTTKGALEAVRKEFDDAFKGEDLGNLDTQFNKFLKEYEQVVTNRTIVIPAQSIADLINQEIQEETKRNYTIAQVPTNQEEYEDMYNEFSRSMDEMELARREDYLDLVKNYLANAENLEDAVQHIMNNDTGNTKLDEALSYLRYMADPSTDIELGGKGQFMTNLRLTDIIETERKKRKDAEKANAEAERNGVGVPPSNEEGAADNNNPPSTGGVQGTGTAAPAAPAKTTTETTAAPPTSPTPGTKPAPAKSAPVADTAPDLGGGDDHLTNPMAVDNTADPLDESYDTPSLKAEIKARQYVMQIGFKNPARLDEIAKALAEGDTSKRDAFFTEVANFLIKQGFDPIIAKRISYKSIKETVNLFGAMNKQSAFARLAQQLAIGFSKKAAEKMSVTELIDGKALDETVDEFLEEYSKLVGNSSISDGKYIINIESLFDYLLNDANVDIRTAMYIYNNLSQFIAKNDRSKYIFTGFNTANKLMLSAVEFINQLKEHKAQRKNAVDKLHISPIELRQRQTKKEAEEYREALTAAHNGTATRIYVEPQYTDVKEVQPNGYEKHKKVMSNLNVIVEYKKGKTTKKVKIGILRTVQTDSYGDKISPIRHQSGFSNIITEGNEIYLDCDFLFEAIINRSDDNGKQLFLDIADYYLATRDIIDKRKKGEITFDEAKELLATTMTKEMANRIMNNPYIKQAIGSQIYKFDVGVKDDDVSRARDISSKIASILFFGKEDDVNDPTNYDHNSFATDTKTLSDRYDTWKQEVKANYEQTYNLQEAITKENETPVISKVNVSYTTTPNVLPNNQFNNIGELEFQHDPNFKDYTPLVYVKNGRLIGENGKDYGEADPTIGDYSMGFITYDDGTVKHVAYFKEYNELKNADITTKVKAEVRRLIIAQLNNVYDATEPGKHEANFAKIGTLLNELFGYQGLFRVGSHFAEGDISVQVSNDGRFINIYHYDRLTKKNKPLMAFFANDSKGNPGHAIRIFGPKYDATTNKNDYVDINDINGNQNISKENVNAWIDYAIEDMFKSVKLNRSALGMTKKTASYGTPSIFDWNPNTNEFNLHLNGETITYNNYADFLTKNNGFKVNVYQNKDGSFVTRYMNENRITIDTHVRQNVDVPEVESHAVSDMLYTSERNPKRKTADSVDVLTAAGVPQEKINILLGTNTGLQIITKRIFISPDKDEAFMYFNNKNKTIHITPKGAFAMNGNPKNAVRLILHENIHRHFNSGSFTNAECQRIVTELEKVYRFVRVKIEEDHANGNLNDNLYKQFNDVLDATQNYKDAQTQMEEFLVECLTQSTLTEWLNNTEYGADADITGITKKPKSILQKIMDILLDLLGIKDTNIKNNSILAREYVILSKDKTLAAIAGTADNANIDRGTPPVEGRQPSTSGIGRDTVGGSPVALEYLLTGGKGTIESTGYFLHGIAAAFPELTNQIENIRSKYLTEINPVPLEYANSGHKSINEIRNLISKKYGSKGVDIFNILLANASGFYERDGRKVSQDIDNLQPIDAINTEVLNRTKTKIDTIRTDFESRITRSPNFAEDHTYLLDGKPIDYSVTQKIHGKQDVGKWGTPASTLGNTADAAARGYFDNNGVVTDDMKIPNVSENQREELIADMSKIEAYLDAKFGKGKYRVITQEFPIGGTITINGEVKTIAGTMDMIVYTDTGDIYIYDFKTKRIGNSDGNISPETLHGYKQQVNIYRQLIEENYPELKGKVHTGSLIKFNVDYPEPNDTIKYRTNPNDSSQLQISRDGGKTYENIQDALVNYAAPTLSDDYENPNVIIPIENQDYGDAIGPLPEINVEEVYDNVEKSPTDITNEELGLDSEGYIRDEDATEYEEFEDEKFATTEQIIDSANSSADIYAPPVANGATDNAYGVKIVNSMNDFVSQFPSQYQADIKQILAANELNYRCE